MGITVTQTEIQNLSNMLTQMDDCSQNIEHIMQMEQQAVHSFDGDILEQLSDDRARCQSELVELESQCRRLLRKSGAQKEMSLKDFIDAYMQAEKVPLQRKRLKLLERMERVQQVSDEHRIRLHAAWHVTTHVLKEIGVLQVKESYAQETYAPGVAR